MSEQEKQKLLRKELQKQAIKSCRREPLPARMTLERAMQRRADRIREQVALVR